MSYMFLVVIPTAKQTNYNLHSGTTAVPAIKVNGGETFEDSLTEVLKILKIESDAWQKSHDEKTWQVTFLVGREESDRVLQHLLSLGIGANPHSSVSIFWSNFHRGSAREESDVSGAPSDPSLRGKEAERSEFIKSVKARLTVAQVVEAVKVKSIITFDYIIFLLISSIISAVGFIEASPVYTVVGILVSPLMGPILAALFGTVIRVWRLARLGLKNEAISLLICITTGLVLGLIISGANNDGVRWAGKGSWPSVQMKDRGVAGSLWVGLVVSIPTGAGVALALLGGSISPLVGVAVSASLLGPIVNSGLLFGSAIVFAIKPPSEVENSTQISVDGLECPVLKDNTYTFEYTCTMATECLYMGLMSLLHTVLAILCVFVTGFIVLKIKEVAPHTTQSAAFDVFWKNDVRIARKTFRALRGTIVETDDVTRQIEEEEKEKRISVLPEVLQDIEQDPGYSSVAHGLLRRPTRLKVTPRDLYSEPVGRANSSAIPLSQTDRSQSLDVDHIGIYSN